MIKDENYYVVQGWMATQLGLKGTKRDVYAIIYGFTQNNESEFSGSLSYLQEWCNASRVTIIKCLQELVDEGFIEKTEEYKNNVKFCRYKATLQVVKKFNYPSKEIFNRGSKETLPNNIEVINNNKEDKDKNKNNKKENDISDVVSSVEDEGLRNVLKEFIKMRSTIKKPLTAYGLNLIINKLNKITPNIEEQIQIVEQSIERCWQGVFPLQKDTKQDSFTKFAQLAQDYNYEE